MSLPALITIAVALWAIALGFLYCLGRVARDPEPGWGPVAVPPSEEVRREMERRAA